MKVALVYDRVNKFGGAERVLSVIHQIYPDAVLYTLVHDQKQAVWARDIKVVPTFLNKIPYFRKHHEILAPIAPFAFETFDFSEYDLVISVTSSDAKSIITNPKTTHICYCLTPTRYLWSGGEEYQNDWKMKIIPKKIKEFIRTVDLLGSYRPDVYISISQEVKNRVRQYYHRDSEVVYPSIDDKFYSKTLSNKKSNYYLVVSRLVPYKKVDLIIEAFNKLNLPLIIVGTGSENRRLESIANKNIKFMGQVSDEELLPLYSKAKALVFPQFEDFGLVPLEAQACGCPVIAFGRGGALETVLDGQTGLFFDKQTVDCLVKAVKEFQGYNFDPVVCRENASRFSRQNFISSFNTAIAKHLPS